VALQGKVYHGLATKSLKDPPIVPSQKIDVTLWELSKMNRIRSVTSFPQKYQRTDTRFLRMV